MVSLEGDFRFSVFGAKAFVAVAFGIGVAWAARQADKHQEIERRNRRIELDLASISPYLAPFPVTEQNEIKKQLAERLFGSTDPVSVTKDGETTGSLIDLLRMTLKTLDNLSKK